MSRPRSGLNCVSRQVRPEEASETTDCARCAVEWHKQGKAVWVDIEGRRVPCSERTGRIDPLAVPREIKELAGRRRTDGRADLAVAERDTRSLVERPDAPVFTPPPDEGTPDVAWLLGGVRSDAHLYAAGDRLPVGVEAFPGRLPNDVVLWIESRRAVIAGDTLVDFGQGLEIPVEWLPAGVTREQVANGLEMLLPSVARSPPVNRVWHSPLSAYCASWLGCRRWALSAGRELAQVLVERGWLMFSRHAVGLAAFQLDFGRRTADRTTTKVQLCMQPPLPILHGLSVKAVRSWGFLFYVGIALARGSGDDGRPAAGAPHCCHEPAARA